VAPPPSQIVGPDAEAVLGDDRTFMMDEGGPATGFLREWRQGPDSTAAGFLGTVLPAHQSDHWSPRWTWDGCYWFLSRACKHQSWLVIKCPVCLVEYFWNTTSGEPISACLGCGFSHWREPAKTAFETWLAKDPKRANHSDLQARLYQHYDYDWPMDLIARPSPGRPDDQTLYDAICYRHTDAVTGKKPPA
jgi:hypothetical protein